MKNCLDMLFKAMNLIGDGDLMAAVQMKKKT